MKSSLKEMFKLIYAKLSPSYRYDNYILNLVKENRLLLGKLANKEANGQLNYKRVINPSFPYSPPKHTFKTLVSPCGFGHSGSGALLDYFSEFTSATVVGSRDIDFSGFKDGNVDVGEIDFVRCAGGLMQLEQIVARGGYFYDDLAIKTYLHIAEFFWQHFSLYTDNFWQITQEFIDQLVDFKIPTDNGFEGIYFLSNLLKQNSHYISRSPLLLTCPKDERFIYYTKKLSSTEYRKLAHNYIHQFLASIEANDFLVCDQIATTPDVDMKRAVDYFGDFKQIAVYRDPRDVYVTGVIKNEQWIPRDPQDFVKWFHHRGTPNYVHAPAHSNLLVIRFEELVTSYESTTKKINNFVGIKDRDHQHRREYFNPEISIKNVGLYKNFADQKAVRYIGEQLKEYCFGV